MTTWKQVQAQVEEPTLHSEIRDLPFRLGLREKLYTLAILDRNDAKAVKAMRETLRDAEIQFAKAVAPYFGEDPKNLMYDSNEDD